MASPVAPFFAAEGPLGTPYCIAPQHPLGPGREGDVRRRLWSLLLGQKKETVKTI